jgi:hypothetical protein
VGVDESEHREDPEDRCVGADRSQAVAAGRCEVVGASERHADCDE